MPPSNPIRLAARALLAALLLAVLPANGAGAAMDTAFDGVLEVVCADADGSKHPRSMRLTQLFPDDGLADLEEGLFLLRYDSSVEGDGAPGRVVARLRHQPPDGERESLGKLEVAVDPSTGLGDGVVVKPLRPAAGGTVDWRLRFQRLGPLDRDDCVVILAGVARP